MFHFCDMFLFSFGKLFENERKYIYIHRLPIYGIKFEQVWKQVIFVSRFSSWLSQKSKVKIKKKIAI